jgi:hypothetical protein
MIMNSSWAMRLVVRFIGLFVTVTAATALPVPPATRIAMLLSGGLLVMIS